MNLIQSSLRLATFSALTIGLLSGGCAVQRAVSKAEPTAFLKKTGTANAGKISRLPFERSWRDASVDTSKYTRVVIRPVTTAYLRSEKWTDSASTFITGEQSFQQEANKLAKYWDGTLRSTFRTPQNQFTLTQDSTKPGTLVIELAITEIVFGRPVANAASYAVPGGGVVNSALFSPAVAFEARVLDGASNRVIATAADRRSSKIKLVDFNKFTFTQANHEICKDWSVEIMQALNVDLFPKVQRKQVSLF
jgi:hypothetical protein